MDSITKAKLHINDAKSFLINDAREEDYLYQNRRFVKKAGHLAYAGLLLVINKLLLNKDKTRSKEWYENELFKIDKKITSDFVIAYQILYIGMGYDGTRSVQLAHLGLKKAEKIIGWVENRLTNHTK